MLSSAKDSLLGLIRTTKDSLLGLIRTAKHSLLGCQLKLRARAIKGCHPF